MEVEITRCPLMTKDPVHPALCWKEFCEMYDNEAKCCSFRLIAIRLGQIFGELAQRSAHLKSEPRVEFSKERKVEAPVSETNTDFKLVK